MHPFFSPPDERRPKNLAQLTQNAAELGKALQGPLRALKIWLSEPVFDALESSAKRQDDTVTTWLRGFFAIHCYGVVYVSEIQRLCPAVFKDPGAVRFSISGPPQGYVSQPVYFVPELGKNTAPVKMPVNGSIVVTMSSLHNWLALKRLMTSASVSSIRSAVWVRWT